METQINQSEMIQISYNIIIIFFRAILIYRTPMYIYLEIKVSDYKINTTMQIKTFRMIVYMHAII